jgi:Flp pilus assembly protein TadB
MRTAILAVCALLVVTLAYGWSSSTRELRAARDEISALQDTAELNARVAKEARVREDAIRAQERRAQARVTRVIEDNPDWASTALPVGVAESLADGRKE